MSIPGASNGSCSCCGIAGGAWFTPPLASNPSCLYGEGVQNYDQFLTGYLGHGFDNGCCGGSQLNFDVVVRLGPSPAGQFNVSLTYYNGPPSSPSTAFKIFAWELSGSGMQDAIDTLCARGRVYLPFHGTAFGNGGNGICGAITGGSASIQLT